MPESSFENYQSPRSFSLLAIGGLAASLICDSLLILFGAGEFLLPSSFALETGETMSIWFVLIGITGLLEIAVLLFSAVAFLLWIYRAYKNLPALKVRHPEHTPGWAVGYWFIPILNLFRPFQVVRELWNESDPGFDSELEFLSGNVGTPAIISWWWAFWILSRLGSNVSNSLAGNKDAVANGSFALALVFAGVLSVAAAALAIQIVKNITRRQELRFEKVGASSSALLPPPPPTFN